MRRSQISFTTGQVAELCDVSQRTVINWIERGELEAHKLPGRGDRRIARSQLEAFFSRNDLPLPDSLLPSARSILIVDDDPDMCSALERLFKSEGYETWVAVNGFDAGLLLAQQRPRLMTLDLHMPGLNGWQVLRRLQVEPIDRLAVLVLSAGSTEELARALSLGADAVMPKPFENAALLNAVEALTHAK